jgi:hypothetical protein
LWLSASPGRFIPNVSTTRFKCTCKVKFYESYVFYFYLVNTQGGSVPHIVLHNLFRATAHITSLFMKIIDTSKCELIYAGKTWTHPLPSNSREMLSLLERQEMYCSWFQPFNKPVEFQFPAIKISAHYYAMSLRMQKAVFRHIRLHPGFVNAERTPSGRHKLRIPQSLLLEKQRTACRFTV